VDALGGQHNANVTAGHAWPEATTVREAPGPRWRPSSTPPREVVFRAPPGINTVAGSASTTSSRGPHPVDHHGAPRQRGPWQLIARTPGRSAFRPDADWIPSTAGVLDDGSSVVGSPACQRAGHHPPPRWMLPPGGGRSPQDATVVPPPARSAGALGATSRQRPQDAGHHRGPGAAWTVEPWVPGGGENDRDFNFHASTRPTSPEVRGGTPPPAPPGRRRRLPLAVAWRGAPRGRPGGYALAARRGARPHVYGPATWGQRGDLLHPAVSPAHLATISTNRGWPSARALRPAAAPAQADGRPGFLRLQHRTTPTPHPPWRGERPSVSLDDLPRR
jgi:hypothetical protein